MIFKLVRPLIALLGFALCSNYSAAQDNEPHGSDALRIYYSDLNNTLSKYDLGDVPFEPRELKVRSGDTLLQIARQQRFLELDFYHLAAALYETNSHAIDDSGKSLHLKVDATLKMPTVGDLFLAQQRYENLKVVGEDLDFNNEDNQMRMALRWPFGKSLVMIGPYAKDELPRNQLVTLTSYRPDAMSVGKDGTANDFLSNPSRASDDQKPVRLIDKRKETYSSWLDQTERTIPIAKSYPLEDTGRQVVTASTGRIEKQTNLERKAVPDTQIALKPVAASKVQATKKPKTEIKTKLIAASNSTLKSNEATKPQVSSPNNKAGIKKQKTVTTIANVDPSITLDSNTTAVVVNSNFYLGPPKNAVPSSSDIQSDPLSYRVEWSFDGSTSVGKTLNKLADYIGYELISDDDIVLSTYNRPLPKRQLRVSDVSAEDGFAILAGRGLETVFDHVTRTVKHIPRNKPVQQLAVSAADNSEAHAKFMQQTGISAMLKQFPKDIQNAAERHASRCESTASSNAPNAEQLHQLIIGNLQQKIPAPVAENLLKWYDSPTGQKVLELERNEIDDEKLNQFTPNTDRIDRIQQIYNDTVTGKGIASIAVGLDYSGWSLSGCKQKAENSGDVQEMHKELVFGQGIKKKFERLEAILRDDMLRSMDYMLSSLSDRELTEYADIIKEHAGIYSELQQSIINAIDLETKEIAVSSLD